jgi:hypothetical protein
MPAATSEATFSTFRLSTQALPERDRLPFWKEQFCRAMLRVEVERDSNALFHASATLSALPGLRMIDCANSPSTYDRTPAHIRDGDDSVSLVINLGKEARVLHCGYDVMLDAGAAVPIFSAASAKLRSTR